MSRAARGTSALAVRPVSPRAGSTERLLSDIRALIESARTRVAQATNAALVLLCWRIGNRIRRDILRERRAGYGQRIIATLSRQLTAEYGSGFGRRNLFNMVRFAEVFPSAEIVQTLSAQLG